MSLYDVEFQRKRTAYMWVMMRWGMWLEQKDPQVLEIEEWLQYTIEQAKGLSFASPYNKEWDFTNYLLDMDAIYFQNLTPPYDLPAVVEHIKHMYHNSEQYQTYIARRTKLNLLLGDDA